ncbi:NCS cytosine-purine permease [Phanerochaete sordida]|uniref:NCS cytosine-purine permease n=1 Tax=Phanerochaete sordida TaxID=48140 RepID=A0A9P3GE00_9APHY|nr:NCS cytosine-purine permease [Phanerochaete sordida]
MSSPTLDDAKRRSTEKLDPERDVETLELAPASEYYVSHPFMRKLLSWGVEARGILPVPREERTDTQYNRIFFIWLSANFNILSFSAGSLGPAVFGLGLRDSCLVILFFNLLASLLPAYLTTWGPRLGLRQMCLSRYSFGFFGVIVPSIFNLASMCGFCILNAILGGQTLASVSGGNLSWSVGIVIVSVVSLFISFCGLKFLSWYERLAWLPVLLVYVVALGIGGKHLINPPPAEPADARTILTFASTIAGFVITYSPLASDFTTYFKPDVPAWKIFWYSYLGLNIPIISVQCLAAAVVVAVPTVPAWSDGYADGNVGGLIQAMLRPAGGFGQFLTVLMALSVTANVAPTLYSFCLSFQVCMPFLAPVPRYVFSVLATAIIVPLSIVGATRFYSTLTDFLGLIGYWASAYAAVVLMEHVIVRKGRFASYDLRYWDSPRKLPTGLAALGACALACALIVPSMDQVWFVGPIAQKTGDIGFELAFAATAVFYVPLRHLELRFRPMV